MPTQFVELLIVFEVPGFCEVLFPQHTGTAFRSDFKITCDLVRVLKRQLVAIYYVKTTQIKITINVSQTKNETILEN